MLVRLLSAYRCSFQFSDRQEGTYVSSPIHSLYCAEVPASCIKKNQKAVMVQAGPLPLLAGRSALLMLMTKKATRVQPSAASIISIVHVAGLEGKRGQGERREWIYLIYNSLLAMNILVSSKPRYLGTFSKLGNISDYDSSVWDGWLLGFCNTSSS